MKHPCSNQKGSALVTVLGISAILTLAAGGLLAVSSMSQTEEDNAWIRERCFQDLESGMMLGTRWLRQIADWDAFAPLTQDFSLSNHCGQFRVEIRRNLDRPGIMTVEARRAVGTDTIHLAWDVSASSTTLPRTVSIDNWRKLTGGGP
jgi:hypothetical protein